MTTTTERVCSVDGCERSFSAKGVCTFHYRRLPEVRARKNARSRNAPIEMSCSICKAMFVRSYVRSNNYCSQVCYTESQRLASLRLRNDPYRPRCSVPDCANAVKTHGFCDGHYQREATGREMNSPLRPKTQNGCWSNGYGYLMVATPEGPRMQHRVIVAEHIGRPLFRHENVHHINGQRDDNRIENLELWSTSQPSGQRVADKVAWAIDFLSEYGYTICAAPSMELAAD